MHKRVRHLCLALAALVAAGTLLAALIPAAEAATYKKGSSGTVVSQIQTKLKEYGVYTGEVDGIYGCVRKIGFRSTVMETEEGAVLTIPNTQLVDSKFLNWTRSNPLRRVERLQQRPGQGDRTAAQGGREHRGSAELPGAGNPVPGAGGEFDPVRGVLLGGRAALVADAGPASLPGTGNFPRKRH